LAQEALVRIAFLTQLEAEAEAELQIYPITLEPNEQAMDWQEEGDSWLLLRSRLRPKGGWRSRIRRYLLTATSLKGGQVLVEIVSPLPAWSLAGVSSQKFVGLRSPPFQKELRQTLCSYEQHSVGRF